MVRKSKGRRGTIERMEESAGTKDADLIHQSRLGNYSPDAARYTSSIDIDSRILEPVIKVNAAHVVMLTSRGIISKDDSGRILAALSGIPHDIRLDDLLEDVHMNVEDYVIRRAGKDAGGMLNLGKSRNDQVAAAIRISLRSELLSIMRGLLDLRGALVARALENASAVMPGYTHLQRAQPVTLGHHLLSYDGMLERDTQRLVECYMRVNRCPMGAGALASSGFRLDRRSVAGLLGFDGLVENSLDAVSSRDFAIEGIFVCAQIMSDLSRLAEEVILWTTKEFSFATVSDAFSASSSMMPQKKNAIVPEIARARSAQVIGDLVGAFGVVKSLPLSYNLDLQEMTRNLWSAVDKTRDALGIFASLIREIRFDTVAMREAVESDETLFATELADYLVSEYGLSFRQAHGRVGALVKRGEETGKLSRFLSTTAESEIASILKLAVKKEELLGVLAVDSALGRRRAVGSPNPLVVRRSCELRRKAISRSELRWARLEQRLVSSDRKLHSRVASLVSRGTRGKGSFKVIDTNTELEAEENSVPGMDGGR